MRLPHIPRINQTVLTEGRRTLIPRPTFWSCQGRWSSQAVAVAQQPRAPISASPTRPTNLINSPGRQRLSHRPFPAHLLLSHALEAYRNPNQSLLKVAPLEYLAQSTSTQLAIVTGQHVLRNTPHLDDYIKGFLCGRAQWEGQLARLVSIGYKWDDVPYWASILEPEDPDERVRRFVRRDHHKPLFVLFYILNNKPLFQYPASFTALLKYCNEWYSDDEFASLSQHDLGMYPCHLKNLLNKLSWHAGRLRPSTLPVVAQLAVAHMRGIQRRSSGGEEKAYNKQCEVFNDALLAAAIPTNQHPYRNSIHNWKALTTLLAYSSALARPLIIKREGYRAIRQVLLMLPKTDSERETATALASSWPPYRILRDGMEEKESTEAYYSRVVKAGIMMQEAGYSKQETDTIMDILGGMAPDGSPTIQTRTNYPPNFRSKHERWAALVRTTRNAQEAWAAFQDPPEPGMIPNATVYWEMILKLTAKSIDAGQKNLPGDGREVFPYDDKNLSDFEKTRVAPPSTRALTKRMFEDDVDIDLSFLARLISRAPNIPHALDCVDHSKLPQELKDKIKWCLEDYEGSPSPWFSFSGVSPRLLHACIVLLCRLQPYRGAHTVPFLSTKALNRVSWAFELAQMRWATTKDKAWLPWERIAGTLAQPNIVLSNSSAEDNKMATLIFAFNIMGKAEAHSGLTPGLFESFSWILMNQAMQMIKTAAQKLPASPQISPASYKEISSAIGLQTTPSEVPAHDLYIETSAGDKSWQSRLSPVFQPQGLRPSLMKQEDIVREAARNLKAAWRVVATTGPAHDPDANSLVTASQINSYMRTLAFLGDHKEMAWLLRWVVQKWAPEVGPGLSTNDAARLAKAFRAFRAFAEPMLVEEVVAPLRERMMVGSHHNYILAGYWPSDADVTDYIQSDKWENHQNLNKVLKFVQASRAVEMEEQENRVERAFTHAWY